MNTPNPDRVLNVIKCILESKYGVFISIDISPHTEGHILFDGSFANDTFKDTNL